MVAVCAAPEAVFCGGAGTTIDGVPALSGTRVFVPSVLRTPKGQFSELLLPGNSIRLLEDSGSRYLGNRMELLTGGVTLNTKTGFSVESGCMTATPDSKDAAHYTVQVLQKTVYVSVLEGEIAVRSQKSVRVKAGRTVAVFCGLPKQEIVFAGNNLPAKVIMGAAAAATPLALLPKSDMSAEGPSRQ